MATDTIVPPKTQITGARANPYFSAVLARPGPSLMAT
jgi:hypothetical protein